MNPRRQDADGAGPPGADPISIVTAPTAAGLREAFERVEQRERTGCGAAVALTDITGHPPSGQVRLAVEQRIERAEKSPKAGALRDPKKRAAKKRRLARKQSAARKRSGQ